VSFPAVRGDYEEYETRKTKFQAEEYADAIDEMAAEEELDDSKSVQEIATEIANGNLDKLVSSHGQTGRPYINKELLRAEYGLSHSDSKAVKGLLEQQFGTDELEKYV